MNKADNFSPIKNSILTVFILCMAQFAFGQSDTLNQVDANGKKTGWCVTYLDNDLNVLQDSAGHHFACTIIIEMGFGCIALEKAREPKKALSFRLKTTT